MKSEIRRWVIGLIAAGLFIQVLFDPLSLGINVLRIAYYRGALPAARAKWERAGLTDYQIEVKGGYPLECTVSARLITREGELAEVQALPRFPSPAQEFFIGPSAGWPGCSSTEYTIPRMFDRLEEVLRGVNPSFDQVKISFDRKYGYILHFEVNSGYQFGLFTPRVGDCCSRFDFENFEVPSENTDGSIRQGAPALSLTQRE